MARAEMGNQFFVSVNSKCVVTGGGINGDLKERPWLSIFTYIRLLLPLLHILFLRAILHIQFLSLL